MTLNALVGVSMNLLALLEGDPHVLNVLLHGFTHFILLIIKISFAHLVLFGLVEHVDAMQALDTFLQLLVVIQVIV